MLVFPRRSRSIMSETARGSYPLPSSRARRMYVHRKLLVWRVVIPRRHVLPTAQHAGDSARAPTSDLPPPRPSLPPARQPAPNNGHLTLGVDTRGRHRPADADKSSADSRYCMPHLLSAYHTRVEVYSFTPAMHHVHTTTRSRGMSRQTTFVPSHWRESSHQPWSI